MVLHLFPILVEEICLHMYAHHPLHPAPVSLHGEGGRTFWLRDNDGQGDCAEILEHGSTVSTIDLK